MESVNWLYLNEARRRRVIEVVARTTNERDKSHIVQINLNAMKLFSGLLRLADGTAITHI